MTPESKQVQVPSKELLTILSSMQLASSRGAFRPEEFTEIGSAYQALYAFLVDLNVITASPATTEAPAGTETPNQ